MKVIYSPLFLILTLLLVAALPWQYQAFAQTEPQKPQEVTPESLQYTLRMGRAMKDMDWSHTYYKSYLQTGEPTYLRLAAQFCGKAIVNLAETQTLLSRTTSFFNQVGQKRLQACRFYDKLQKKSFLLTADNHLPDSGSVCE